MNASSITGQQVSCPVVRDTTLNTNGLFADVSVYSYNSGYKDAFGTTEKVTCTFNVTDITDGTSFGTKSDSSAASAGNFELRISITTTNSGGSYDIQCFLGGDNLIAVRFAPQRN